MGDVGMEKLTLSKRQARRFILAHQGLWPPHELEEKSGVLRYIRRVGCIQFDPLNIVGHNPELVLQARVSDFRPTMLEELLYEDRRLLDGWDKNMSIYCVEDWPYFRRHREYRRHHSGKSSEAVETILPQVRQAIEKHGPLSSIDLDFNQTVDWSWAPTRLARAALESMYGWGELIIHHKVHTRKVYDFASQHLPEALLSARDPNETEEQYHDWHVCRRIGSVGLMWNRSGGAWLGNRGVKSRERRAALIRLLWQGKVVEVHVEGVKPPFYIRNEDEPRLREILDTKTPAFSPRVAILAPLDNLLWDRRLVEELFGFRYTWEVYKPAAERQYGYYVLPVLYGDRFVARCEPTFDKETRVLSIEGWWWEADAQPDVAMQAALIDGFRGFMRYLGAGSIRLSDAVVDEVIIEGATSALNIGGEIVG
jgi:hypothetical protein